MCTENYAVTPGREQSLHDPDLWKKQKQVLFCKALHYMIQDYCLVGILLQKGGLLWLQWVPSARQASLNLVLSWRWKPNSEPKPRPNSRPNSKHESDHLDHIQNSSLCLSSLCLSVSLSLCLSVSLSICLSVSLSLCLSACLSLSLSLSLSVSVSLSLSLSLPLLSLSLSLYIYIYINCLSLSPSLYSVSVCLSLYLYISMSLSLSLSLYLYISISLYLCISLSLYLFISISLSLYISLYIYIYIYIYIYMRAVKLGSGPILSLLKVRFWTKLKVRFWTKIILAYIKSGFRPFRTISVCPRYGSRFYPGHCPALNVNRFFLPDVGSIRHLMWNPSATRSENSARNFSYQVIAKKCLFERLKDVI